MQELNLKIFENFPILKTPRLTLREIRVEDMERIYQMRSNGRVNQFIARDNMDAIEDAKKLIEKVDAAFLDKQAIAWAGILRDNKSIIGTCGFNHIDYPNLRAEIGGELSVDYWGKNIPMEAVIAILKFGFEVMNLHTVEAKVSPENRSVIYLLTKLGFNKEAHYTDRIYFKDNFSDMAVYTLLINNFSY